VHRRVLLTWDDVESLIDHLVPQFETEFDAMVLVTRGGIVPGGMLCEALDLYVVLTAAVDFPFEIEQEEKKLLAWPRFIQFPDAEELRDRRVLIVDDVWGSGRTITAVKNRVSAVGGNPSTCVLHYNPYRNLFSSTAPDYFAAVTDVHVIYPWEIHRDHENVLLDQPDSN